MSDTPKNEWAVPMFTPEGKPQRCSWGRDGMVMCASDGEWVEWEHYAELEQAVKDGETLEREPDGTVVIYGEPKPEHNCDEMGCPSLRHVLLVLRARQGAQDG